MRNWPQFKWRIGVLFLVGFLAVITVPIGLFYVALDSEQRIGLPQPKQLAAIVKMVEQTPLAERYAFFETLQSAQLSVRASRVAEVTTDLEPLWVEGTDKAQSYAQHLGDRDFAAYAVPRRLFPNGLISPLRALEFRVALNTGEVLLIASEGAVFFSATGVPLGFTSAVLGILIGFVALFLLNREFRPVIRLAKAVEAMDPTDPNAELPPIHAGTSEVRQLIDAFTRQQSQIASLLRTRAALIGGIQHDVRTFATRLRLRLEKLPDERDRTQAETDISDLVSLMDGALLATRTEVGALDIELIELSTLIQAEVQDRTATGAPVSLTVEPNAKGVRVLADRIALRRILFNLIENALRYGRTAHLTLNTDQTSVTLQIDDSGPGIPAAHRDDLLQPFSRLDPSRSRETGGAGLGLAIASTLVASHEGQLTIEDAPSGGARISMQLPQFRTSGSVKSTVH